MRPLADRFVPWGPQHLVVLGVFALGCVVAVLLGRRRPAGEPRAGAARAAGVVVLVVCLPFTVADWVDTLPRWRTSLPLQICDLAWIVAGVALLTGARLWCALLYYWGLTLCLQGVLTPSLTQGLPQWQFFGYWARHLLPPWTALYLVGARAGPSWSGYRRVLAITGVWAAGAIVLNTVFGSNYGYLRSKPTSHSLLDVLGPWPWYVVVEMTIVAAGWALITWPWNRRGRG